MIKEILDFFFPRQCVMCDRRLSLQEQHICLPCYMHLPRTMHHTVEHSPAEKLFWGKLPIEKAASFFHYKDGNKEILLQLKYKNNPEIGTYIASQYAKEIKDSGFFDDIDIIVPIPLHWRKRMQRGYNQCTFIAEGIRSVTGIPICTKAVKRIVNNVSQTLMMRDKRHDNVEGIFRLTHPELISGKHVLIIDDVTTTGSTIYACAKEILKAPDTRISVLTLAFASTSTTPVSDAPIMPTTSPTASTISKL